MRPNNHEFAISVSFIAAYCIQFDLREGTVYCAMTHQGATEMGRDIGCKFSEIEPAALRADDMKGEQHEWWELALAKGTEGCTACGTRRIGGEHEVQRVFAPSRGIDVWWRVLDPR